MTVEAHLPDGTVLQFPAGTGQEVVQRAVKSVLAGEVGLEQRLDKRSGAAAGVRAAVGGASTPEDRLATLQKFHPDAKPYGDDNFVFAHPETGRPTLYNEENARLFGIPLPTIGDIASIGPEIAEGAGAIVGGAAGVAATPVTGGASLATVPMATGLGAAAGREMYGLLANSLLGTQDTRTLPQHLADTALTTGVNAVAGPAADAIAAGVRTATGPVARYMRGAVTDLDRMASFDRLNVAPMAGAATGNRVIQTLEQGAFNTPGGAQVMQGAADRTLASVDQAAQNVASRYAQGAGAGFATAAPMTAEEVGGAMRTAAKGAASRFEDRAESLYKQAGQRINYQTPAAIPNASALRADLAQQIAKAPESLTPVLGPIVERIGRLEADAQAGMPFEALRQVRSTIGRELSDPVIAGGTGAQKDALRALYGKLSDDMMETAKQSGPDAVKALTTADRYYRFNITQNMPILQQIVDTNADGQILSLAMRGAKDGGQQLNRIRRNVKPGEWDLVAGTVLGRMGRATPGAQGASELGAEAADFSAATFLTNWSKLSKEARAALFGGTRYRALEQPLNDLAKVTDSLKDAQKMANTSGTARSVGTTTLLTALGSATGGYVGGDTGSAGGAALGTAAALTTGGYGAAKLLTNPRFVRWLATSAQVVNNNPNALRAQIARLAGIAKAEPDLREAIDQYITQIQPAPEDAGAAGTPSAR